MRWECALNGHVQQASLTIPVVLPNFYDMPAQRLHCIHFYLQTNEVIHIKHSHTQHRIHSFRLNWKRCTKMFLPQNYNRQITCGNAKRVRGTCAMCAKWFEIGHLIIKLIKLHTGRRGPSQWAERNRSAKKKNVHFIFYAELQLFYRRHRSA